MREDRDVYVVAPRPGRPVAAGWKDDVQALAGVRVLGRDGFVMQVSATPGAADAIGSLYGDGLRIEPVRGRAP